MTNISANKKATIFTIAIHILVVFWVSSNLRAPITAVGPVISELSQDLQLSNFQSSLITSIPLFIFAFCSVFISKFAADKNISKVLLYGLLILATGTLLRLSGTISSMMLGSILVGFGICVGNVITPGYIKNYLSKYLGLMTGLFAVAMNLTAAFASGFSIQLGKWTTMGWRGSLGVWIVNIVIAILILLFNLGLQKKRASAQNIPNKSDSNFNMFKSRQAWNISIYMGIQSIIYYCVVSWLPTVLKDYGIPYEDTGWVLFVFQISTIPLTFIGPVIANRMKNQKPIIAFVVIVMSISVVLFASGSLNLVYLAAALLGISNGLAFSLSLLFFSIRTQHTAHVIKLSGMAQSIGYFIAAFGPPIFGMLHDFDASWKTSFYFLLLAILGMVYFGWQSARNKFVESQD